MEETAMKRMIWLVLMSVVALICGCITQPQPEDPFKPPLVRELEVEGVTHLNTDRVIVRDTEAGYGGHAHVIAGEQFIVQEIWDSIYASRPYHKWCASGFRKVEFYKDDNPENRVVTLLVNETGEAHLEGKGPEDGFRCPGLVEVVSRLLDYKYRKPAKESATKDSPAATVVSDKE